MKQIKQSTKLIKQQTRRPCLQETWFSIENPNWNMDLFPFHFVPNLPNILNAILIV